MFYRAASRRDNARWYDPALGRFAQADSIVPGGVQGWDRYAYTLNNPIRYNDPTGHFTDDQIKKHLKAVYGEEKWSQVWALWEKDEYWMWVLHTAEPGWDIWASDNGNIGHFAMDGDKIVLQGIDSDGQAIVWDLWEFQGQGVYLLRGPNGERPRDDFSRSGYYMEPVYDYNENGFPRSPNPIELKHVVKDKPLFGYNPIMNAIADVSIPPDWGPENTLTAEIPGEVQQMLPPWASWILTIEASEFLFKTRVYTITYPYEGECWLPCWKAK